VDSWVRKYGPDTSVSEVLRGNARNDEAENGEGDGEQQPPPPPQSSPQDAQAAADAAAEWRVDDSQQRQHEAERAERAKKEAEQAAQRAAQQKEAALKALKKAKKLRPGALRNQEKAQAKRLLKSSRRAMSHNHATMASAPSRVSRQNIASAHGRLRRVPATLRTRVAEIINRLVADRGTVGSNVSTIPVYDSRKLVKRMLVKRPLANALKEDVVSGRPVTLFLPDISPSCEDQAQAACDMANAAGYAGVSGSDVLVLPHSNGCIEGEADNYIPWFNGKPVNARGQALEKLFNDITAGRSPYRIRAVVAIGDHDAINLYEQVVALRSVIRMVWLHNDCVNGPGAKLSGDDWLPGWSWEYTRKLKLLYGCTNQKQMLRGLDIALR
jgi:hypothetical protein